MADILIKNMEMPSCCENCRFNQFYDAKHWTTWNFCMFLDKDTDDIGEGRLADCPLVALPEHGDLADKIDMIHLIEKIADADLAQDIIGEILASPTIVEATE